MQNSKIILKKKKKEAGKIQRRAEEGRHFEAKYFHLSRRSFASSACLRLKPSLARG
jgi:hypothetical protein